MRFKDVAILLSPIAIAILALVLAPIALLPATPALGPAQAPPAPATPPPGGAPGGGGPGNPDNGRQLFVAQGCAGCHTIADIPGAAGTTGPELTHIATVAAQRKPGMSAEDYIRESITNPTAFVAPGYQPVMPKLPLNEQQVNDLVAMLMQHQ